MKAMRYRTLVIAILIELLMSWTISYANEPIRPEIYKLEQDKQNICIMIEDGSDRGMGEYISYYKIMKKTEVEESVLMDYTMFPHDDALYSKKFCNDAPYLDSCPECIDCDGDGIKECPSDCRTTYIYLVSDLCIEPMKIGYKLLYRISNEFYGDYGIDGEGEYQFIETSESGYSCDESKIDPCKNVENPFGDNDIGDDSSDNHNGNQSGNQPKSEADSKIDDSSCGCSSFTTGDPAGMLTATMLLFAFFALAFERIRRKK